MFSFVKIKEIQIPEPFTDHSLLWEAAVFIHKKIMSELLLFLTHKKKIYGEMPENILLLTKSLQDCTS